MDIKTLIQSTSVEKRVSDAVNKAHAVQDKLNAMVSFIEPSEQLKTLESKSKDCPFYGVPVVLKDLVNSGFTLNDEK